MIRILLRKLRCFFGEHDWTCAAAQGIQATPEQLKSIDGFWDYAKMYCKACGKVYQFKRKTPP